MAKEKTGDWYYDSGRHKEDLERDLAGLISRHAELRAMEGASKEEVAAAEEAVKHAKEQLRSLYGVGQEKASKRPAQAREKRAAKK